MSCGQMRCECLTYFYGTVACLTLEPVIGLCGLTSWTFHHPSDKEGSSASTTSLWDTVKVPLDTHLAGGQDMPSGACSTITHPRGNFSWLPCPTWDSSHLSTSSPAL